MNCCENFLNFEKSIIDFAYQLVGSLHNGFLQLNLLNEQNREHILAIKINTSDEILSYRLDSTSEQICEITEGINLYDTEVVVTLGDGGNSMIGCVTLVTVGIDNVATPRNVIPLSSNEVDDCDNDQNCEHRDCNEGKCLQLEVATCDCYGTEMSGPNCRYPAQSVFVVNNNDESRPNNIRYTPWKVDQLMNRITIDFKFADDDNREGVLLHSRLSDGSVMKLYVVESRGNLIFGSLGQKNFTLDTTKEFHSILINIHHESHFVDLVVDEQLKKLFFDKSIIDLSLTSLLFGGSPVNKRAREIGITGCLKNIYVDHYDIIYMMYNKDKRVEPSMQLNSCDDNQNQLMVNSASLPNKESHAEPILHHFVSGTLPIIYEDEAADCEKSQDYLCRNGAACERRGENITCLCKQGFGGKYCQFTLRPRNCAEAYAFHGIAEGTVHLDVDGTLPLHGSVATCQNGTTIVPHDMPNSTVIRSSGDTSHALFIVSYRDFTYEKLSRLIKFSGSCRQQVLYECDKAALGFEFNQTWFNVAIDSRTVTQIGRLPNSCPCMDTGCIKNMRCNCDSKDSISSDIGYLYDGNAGITKVVALHAESDLSGRLTIGPLQCQGFAGDGPIRFSRSRALLIGNWRGRSLSLQFRTATSSATVFTAFKGDDVIVKAELINGMIF
ncbi:EGF-like domain protein [Dictyocaulus viviparus]|uniref:EGF-like domain protein n=1 Tax=Dictyocaulus viviparus TaxID=29172 RepID=A0A0D8XWJ4_DICVI|nr:EGF-like domain protein [Dictyocaulus viviparus]